MHMNRFRRTVFLATLLIMLSSAASLAAQQTPDAPRIESFVPAGRQPLASASAVIWYDDFNQPARQAQYAEKQGELTKAERFGGGGSSLEMNYPEGSRGIGNRKIFFGDCPASRGKVVRGKETFDEIYWRVYVKHPADWQGGGPAKLSRATSLVPPGWRQAMISHVWSQGEALTLDPASGVQNGEVVTRRYNDFANLKWLGNRPASQFKLHGADGLGWWVCIEARVKLNTPGKKDGENQLWIDGRLEAERKNLDWRGTFDEYGINAVFLEAYWNEGSPIDQARWFDNFVVSTQPIGPVVCSRNPQLIKTAYKGPGQMTAWQVELAADAAGKSIVWQSYENENPETMLVDRQHGKFRGALADADRLAGDTLYYCRVRQQSSDGAWSAWSPWHQPLRTSHD